jgi:hypothetical protein
MPGLLRLPNELRLDSGSYLWTRSLCSLVLTHRRLQRLLEKRLYERPQGYHLRHVIARGNPVAFRRLLECDLDKNSVLKHGQAILRYDSLRGYTSYHCNEYPVLAHVVRKMTSQPYEMVKVLLDAGLINISEWGVFVGDWAARQPSNEGNRLAQLLRSYWVSIITEGYAYNVS